jgi:hypothetical protein
MIEAAPVWPAASLVATQGGGEGGLFCDIIDAEAAGALGSVFKASDAGVMLLWRAYWRAADTSDSTIPIHARARAQVVCRRQIGCVLARARAQNTQNAAVCVYSAIQCICKSVKARSRSSLFQPLTLTLRLFSSIIRRTGWPTAAPRVYKKKNLSVICESSLSLLCIHIPRYFKFKFYNFAFLRCIICILYLAICNI